MRQLQHLIVILLFASSVMWTSQVFAAETPAAEASASATSESSNLAYSPQWPEPPNAGAMLLRLCLGTVFVLALCVCSLWLGKPWLQKLQGGATTASALKIEGTVMLGNRAVLYLVKVGDTQLVAGTDATGLKSLITLPASFKEVLDEQLPGETIEESVDAPSTNLELRLRAATGT